MLMWMLYSLAGLMFTVLMAFILNKMPAKCFCDYNETPDERHNSPRAGKGSLILSGLVLAVVFPILVERFGLGLKSVSMCLLCVCMVMIVLSDIRFCIIPDELIIAGCILATIGVFPDILTGSDWSARLSPVLGAAVGAGVIFGINCLGRLVYKKDALGMGDLKLMAVCGIACGAVGIAIALLVGIFAAGVWFAVGIVLKRVSSEEYMPMGPFLIFGTIFVLCFRPAVDTFLAWYISLI